MDSCFICGEDLRDNIGLVSRETAAGIVKAHQDCVTKLSAILGPETVASITGLSAGVLEKVGNEWVLIERNLPTQEIAVLAYLAIQDGFVEVAEVYKWLGKNEIRLANPSDYIFKLKKNSLVAVVNTQQGRMIRITEAGRRMLGEFTRKRNAT